MHQVVNHNALIHLSTSYLHTRSTLSQAPSAVVCCLPLYALPTPASTSDQHAGFLIPYDPLWVAVSYIRIDLNAASADFAHFMTVSPLLRTRLESTWGACQPLAAAVICRAWCNPSSAVDWKGRCANHRKPYEGKDA